MADNNRVMTEGDTIVLDGQWWTVKRVTDDGKFEVVEDDTWDYVKDYAWVEDASLDDGGYWEADE